MEIDDDFKIDDVPEQERLAFYGALFAMSAVDDHVDRDELFAIFEMLEIDDLSPEAQEEIRGYAVNPPSYRECVDKLEGTDEALRRAAVVNLVEVAEADEVVEPEEEDALAYAVDVLGVTTARADEIVPACD